MPNREALDMLVDMMNAEIDAYRKREPERWYFCDNSIRIKDTINGRSWNQLKKLFKTWSVGIYFKMPLNECPLYINNPQPYIAAIMKWRLKRGR